MTREVSVDPQILERIADSDTYYNIWEEEPLDRTDDIMMMRRMVEKLEPDDQELYQQYYIEQKSQCECAAHFNLSQPMISFWLTKLEQRLKVITELPDIDIDYCKSNLSKLIDDINVDIIMTYVDTASQKTTAEIITNKYGKIYKQGNVRW